MITIEPQTVLDTLAYDITPREKERLLILDYAFLIRQQQVLGMEVDFPSLSKAVIAELGMAALRRITDKAWKRYRAWARGGGEREQAD